MTSQAKAATDEQPPPVLLARLGRDDKPFVSRSRLFRTSSVGAGHSYALELARRGSDAERDCPESNDEPGEFEAVLRGAEVSRASPNLDPN